MDIFQMERSGNGSKRFPKPVISFLIAFCLLYIASMFYRSSTSVLIGEVARDNITGEVTENVTRCYETESEDKRSSGTESMAVDKFLGGLLATGFDEESCTSRYQAALYRKTSSHKPSAYLVSKLRKYEELHKRCGPNTESYRRTLKKLSSSHTNGTTDCNYIVWTPSNGLGNRIISMASSFLYAVLTNRVLLVDHGSDMAGIFCEPFPDTSWLLPMDFPLTDQLHSLQPGNVHSYGHLLKMNNLDISTVSQAPSFLHLYLAYNYNKHDKLFFQDQNQGFLQKVPWLILKSDLYFVPYLFLLPSFQQELGKLFPDKEAVFHHLARYLFHPSNQAWGLITRFYQAYLASADQKIGLQVRVFNRKASPVSVVQKQILGCIKKEKLLPQVDERKRIAFPSKNKTSRAVTIASLYPEYYESIKSMYWMNPTVNGDVIGVYQPSHEEVQHWGNNIHNLKAWAEINILSLSDVLMTSSWSTFGYVAQGLGGLKPWILHVPAGNQTTDRPCPRAKSMEPCFLTPPDYHRIPNTRGRPHAVSPVPHVMKCEDAYNGIKLFNPKQL
ncbi:galactoside alpha-L-fucosyltransferase [Salix suchowensis]|nr:galactoside alpha-L-fucosyltransferase [Salix suchowensis]